MPEQRAFVGVADHNGWAVLMTVTADGAVLDRRRVELVDPDLPSMPHHHDAQGLPLDRGVALVERVRASAARCSVEALESIAHIVNATIAGVALRTCPPLPPTVAERLRDYRAQNVADTVMYRDALAAAAEARRWRVHWYVAKSVIDEARAGPGFADLDERFAAVKQSIGPPWGVDQRIAMAAAIVASRSSRR